MAGKTNQSMSRILYRIILLGLLSVSALGNPGAVRAQKTSAAIEQMLRERDAQIKKIIGTTDSLSDPQRETLKDVINGVIDFEAMSRSALGPHWKPLSPEERKEFVDVFADIVRSQSLSNLDVYRSTVTYDEISVDGDEAQVVTTTLYKDVPTKVEYDMVFRDDEWHITDIILDEVSTTQGYARSFQSVVRKKGFEALMASLVKRRDREEGRS